MLKDRLKIQLQFLEENKTISSDLIFLINEKNEIKLRKYPRQGRKLYFTFLTDVV